MKPFKDRFWSKVIKGKKCWDWCAYRNADGYGRFRLNNGLESAHRVSWIIHNGPIPQGKQILHKCDNRSCVNPKHLFIGTHLENMRDMIKKGRRATLKGESNPNRKLTEEDVLNIRKEHSRYKRGIAKKYGISHFALSCIVKRKTWKHI